MSKHDPLLFLLGSEGLFFVVDFSGLTLPQAYHSWPESKSSVAGGRPVAAPK